ncbi:hypothetical protein [Pseudomonas sp. ML96]|uniref:hypothetical protein n=1 Tax=Pseudomonas sp. ML96 TaxID=1523503 RepID=UPI00068EA9AC|nr:hypothetical protein [Pseudomonas sp. ML96]
MSTENPIVTREHLAALQVFANDMITAALGGGDVDGPTIQEQAVKHGLLARRIMTTPCCGPEEGFCSCAHTTSFPAECFRKTVALVAELSQTSPPQSAPAGAVHDALEWLDDFVARCNGDDRGACSSVNILRDALAAAPQPAARNGWIPYSEQKPDGQHRTEYLIYFEDTGKILVDEWIDEQTEGWCFWFGDPSHWMPLPASPVKQSEGEQP